MTIAGRKSNPNGFRLAVEDLNRAWLRSPNFDDYSLALLILQSVQLAGRYNIQYPGEIILMVKALVTLEGVGNVLDPGIDVAQTARKYVREIMLHRFNLSKIIQDGLIVLPEIMDILATSPLVINDGLRYLETHLKQEREGPLAELRGTLFAGFSLLAGAIIAASGGAPWLWGFLLLTGFSIAGYGLFSRR
jgi:ubiquinone biosynthesis protein